MRLDIDCTYSFDDLKKVFQVGLVPIAVRRDMSNNIGTRRHRQIITARTNKRIAHSYLAPACSVASKVALSQENISPGSGLLSGFQLGLCAPHT